MALAAAALAESVTFAPGSLALEERGASPAFAERGVEPGLLAGMGDSERIRRLLSQTGVKKPDKRSKSPILKFFEGLEDSISLSSLLMVFPRVGHGVARRRVRARSELSASSFPAGSISELIRLLPAAG